MKPPITLTAQPTDGNTLFFLPIAPRKRGDPQWVRIVVGLVIQNTNPRTPGDSSGDVTLDAITFSFPGSSTGPIGMNKVKIALDPVDYDDHDDGMIPAGERARWSNGIVDGPDNHVFLPADEVPSRLRVDVHCEDYDEPQRLEFDLVPYVEPVGPGEGAYLLPFAAGDFEPGEYLVGSAIHWANGQGAGTQIMAHDLWVEKRGTWSKHVDGTNGDRNDEHRIWGMPVRAIADGTVIDWENEIEDNSVPGVKDSTVANFFWIQHGTSRVKYVHFQHHSLTPSLMVVGAQVAAGQQLGLAGNSGRSDFPHLHLEARDFATSTLRGLPFRDALVLDPALVGIDDGSEPWFELLNHGLSKEKVAVKNKSRRGRRPWRAVDFLSTILPAHVYEIFHLPDPPPDELLEQLGRDRVKGMRADQRKSALKNVRRLMKYLDGAERALNSRPTR